MLAPVPLQASLRDEHTTQKTRLRHRNLGNSTTLYNPRGNPRQGVPSHRSLTGSQFSAHLCRIREIRPTMGRFQTKEWKDTPNALTAPD